MANQDSFIDEVNEEVRRDRLFKLMRRYGWIAVVVVLAVVGGAAFNEWRKASMEAEAQATGDAILAALEAEDPETRATALGEIDSGDSAGKRALLSLIAAAAEEQTGNRDAALETLNSVAVDAEIPAIYRDLAILKSMILGADRIEPIERIERLNGLALSGGAYRLLAMEQIALAEIQQGNRDAAIQMLIELLADAEVSQDLRRRASQLIVALGGSLADT